LRVCSEGRLMENDSIFADDKHANSSWFLLFTGQMSLLPLSVEEVCLSMHVKSSSIARALHRISR
jgi:hypothetical protein